MFLVQKYLYQQITSDRSKEEICLYNPTMQQFLGVETNIQKLQQTVLIFTCSLDEI